MSNKSRLAVAAVLALGFMNNPLDSFSGSADNRDLEKRLSPEDSNERIRKAEDKRKRRADKNRKLQTTTILCKPCHGMGILYGPNYSSWDCPKCEGTGIKVRS